LPEAAASRSSGRGWKIACLALLCCALGLAVYEQQLWRSPLLRDWISSFLAAPVPRATPPTPANLPDAPTPDSVERSLPTVHSPGTTAKPPKQPLPQSPIEASPSEAAPTTESSAAPTPSEVNRESPERAPAIPPPAGPAELPAIIKPPSASPVLQGARAPAPAHESASPPVTRVSQVIPGALIFKVNPEYPAAARSARVQGSVVMHAIIGTDGSVQQLRLRSGNPLLVSAAMEAVKKWRYRPFLLDGNPVEGETVITVNFKGE
jgi:protein TonB